MDRQDFFSLAEIEAALDQYLKPRPFLDFITFSGSGEPTLYKKLGELVSFIKENHSGYKIALLTNSTLLGLKTIQDEILAVDLVLPSLDAASQEVFVAINKPHKTLRIENIIEGLINFRRVFRGQMWLEVFIIPEINDNESELAALKKAIIKIQPDRVQLNSLDRPGTAAWVKPATYETLSKIRDFFAPLPVEIINAAKIAAQTPHPISSDLGEIILKTLACRPSTLEDLALLTGVNPEILQDYMESLIKKGNVTSREGARGIFYSA